jgi:hypothetical protein
MDSLNVLAGSIGHGTGSSQRNMKMSMKVKSEKQEFTFFLSGGPWMIYGHYLVVQPWSRDFTTSDVHPTKIVAWIRLPGLHYRY